MAALINVPFQNNFEFDGGPRDDSLRYQLNFQPVAPFSIHWNLISRTIVQFIHQEDEIGSSSHTGLGDTRQSLFLSPAEPMGSWLWGAGPVFLIPCATDDALGTEKFGVGRPPCCSNRNTVGPMARLANHIWSVAGEGGRQDVNASYRQPFLTYTTKKHTTFALNTETTYDWDTSNGRCLSL